MSTQPTLDYLAATVAQKIVAVVGKKAKNGKVEARDVETLATKALSVLQSQGVYAMALFLFSRSGKETQPEKMKSEERIATQILAWLRPLQKPKEALSEAGKPQPDPNRPNEINQTKDEVLREFAELSKDLDTLLLVRDLYEQTLIYVRYHAKAASD